MPAPLGLPGQVTCAERGQSQDFQIESGETRLFLDSVELFSVTVWLGLAGTATGFGLDGPPTMVAGTLKKVRSYQHVHALAVRAECLRAGKLLVMRSGAGIIPLHQLLLSPLGCHGDIS